MTRSGTRRHDRLREWESAGLSRRQIETAMNAVFLENIFQKNSTEATLKARQEEHLASIMIDMLPAKLVRDFPDLRFSTFVMGDDDFGVSFHQL